MGSDVYPGGPEDPQEDSLAIEFPPGLEPSGAVGGSGPVGSGPVGAGGAGAVGSDTEWPETAWTAEFAAQDTLGEQPSGRTRPDAGSPHQAQAQAQSQPLASQAQAQAGQGPRADHFQVGGRNLVVATVVGVVLIGFVVASLVWLPWAFAIFVALFLSVGVFELNSALLVSTAKPIGWIVTVCTPLIIIATYLAGIHLTWKNPLPISVSPFSVVIGSTAVVMLLVCAWRLLGPTEGYVADVSKVIFVLVYLPVLGSSIILLMLGAHPVAGVLMCILCPVANDTGAYAVGVATSKLAGGNHKMAPRISPAKSWEGFFGGLLVGVIAGALFGHFALGYSWLLGAICGLVLALVGVLGDLIESIVKRDVGLKDFGHIIPGHGGAMDRIDSIIFAAPVFYLFTGILG